MKKENKNKLYVITAMVLAAILVFLGIYFPDSPATDVVGQVQNIVIDEIQAIDENIVVEDVTENEEISSTEETTEEATIKDEQELETEEVTEVETFELQDEENISYDGDRAKTWNVELGEYQGLTYFSQIDRKMEKYNVFICRRQNTNNRLKWLWSDFGCNGCFKYKRNNNTR